MPKRNGDYWRQRFDQIGKIENNKSAKYLHELEEKTRRAEQQIDAQINSWYQRFANNNEITVTEAKRLLNSSELAELRWSVQDYIKHGQENAIDQRWAKELENASAKFHINRLEALKLQTRQQIEVMTGGMVDDVDRIIRNVYKDTYYRSAFEIQKGVGIGFDVGKVDEKKLSKLVNKPWAVDGKNFSERIWGNKAKLLNTLDQELSRMVLTGESPKRAIDNIKKAMHSSTANTQRLVFTEQAYFTSLAQHDLYDELDVEEFEFVGTLDGLTCELCGDMDGKHFPVKDMVIGVNAPPMHPECGCDTCPYFDDEFTDGLRASRNEAGETVYEVPEKMTYKEWKNSFVNGGSKEGLKPITPEKVTVTNSEKDFSSASYGSKEVTQEWLSNATNRKGTIKDTYEFIQDGVRYTVDGKHVVLDYKEPEKRIAKVLHSELGSNISMIPKVLNPQNVQTPDFLIDGRRYDLKSPIGSGKEVLFNMVKGKQKQADNFVFDISNCPLKVEELIEQAKKIFTSRHTRFVDNVILVKEDKVILILERN